MRYDGAGSTKSPNADTQVPVIRALCPSTVLDVRSGETSRVAGDGSDSGDSMAIVLDAALEKPLHLLIS